MLNLYTTPESSTYREWQQSSIQASIVLRKNHTQVSTPTSKIHTRNAKSLPVLASAGPKAYSCNEYIEKRKIPVNPFGSWAKSLLETHPDLKDEVMQHLLSVGKYVQAHDINDVKGKYGLEDTIPISTAKCWMKELKFHWVRNHVGQYVDGHERADVVHYRQEVFLPAWYRIEGKKRSWTADNVEELAQWVADGVSPEPYAKGEGISLMVADFVSADYGWLCSKDGKELARVIFCPGKNCDGYFDNDDILAQTYHVFVFDNATTHLKRAEDALSAHKMPKFTPKEGTNWGVEVTLKAPDGSTVYDEKGKPKKTKIRMTNGKFADGTAQEFYFPAGHSCAGIFKGMAQILLERGHMNAHALRSECPKFKCDPLLEGKCCCRRLLFNEPDFAADCFEVLFFPKFHCELNFIEQCWGSAKRNYRLMPTSSKEKISDLITMFARRSRRFMDAYHQGLTGKQAAWAGKKYHGH
ncbi:hypothetical protein DFJ43DRAFT_1134541 [Lentinula guzmanii]|uniref:Uncharacterized protein n=1 Tax=Lentinula guzmanii TaxID=2804957 RepID=A0AA38J854_9AGAR|nr:hypothetical protein DFJ43DRAFT_1134541 [Lentinula guzmanii]